MNTPTATSTSPTNDGSDMLRRFASLRMDVLTVVHDAKKLTDHLGAFKTQFDRHVELVDTAVSARRLNLVVLGGEGAGKSTFVNMLLGREVSPACEQQPGTVAPVFIEYDEHTEPRFAVALEGQPGERACADRAEFETFLLQSDNEDNQKKVVNGLVRFRHPLLRDGLRIVDVPGVEGVSSDVKRQVEVFLAEQAHAVIAIQKMRDYAPLARALERLSSREFEIDALVSNQFYDFWFNADDEIAVAKKVTDQRVYSVEQMRKKSPELPLDPTDVFVVSLTSMQGGGGRQQVRSLTQDKEAEALRARLWQRCGARGFGRVLMAGVDEAGKTLALADAHLRTRHTLIETIRSGGTSASQVSVELAAARTDAETKWATRVDQNVVKALAAQEWPALGKAITVGRDTLLNTIGILEQRLRTGEESIGRVTKSAASRLHDELSDVATSVMADIDVVHRQMLGDISQRYLENADELLSSVYNTVPALHSTRHGHTHVDIQDLIAFHFDRLDDDAAGFWSTLAGAGGLAAAGGMLAGGQGIALLAGAALGPVAALVVGAIGAGAPGGFVVQWARGGQRSSVLKHLAQARRAAEAMDTSRSGVLYREWEHAVTEVADGVGALFTDRLNALEAVVRDPAGGNATLTGELEAIETAQAHLRVLDARLIAIGQRAAQAAP